MDTSRQDSLLRQLLSALRKPWDEGTFLQIIDGLPTWGPAGGAGVFAGCEYQLTNNAAPGPLPLQFNTQVFSDGATAGGGKFYPGSEGWWVAWSYLHFFGGANTHVGVMGGEIRLSDNADSYIARESYWPMLTAAEGELPDFDYSAGLLKTEPVKIDSSYANPYFWTVGTTHRMDVSGSVPGNFQGFGELSNTACRMGIYKVG